jgi:hypothetical protein
MTTPNASPQEARRYLSLLDEKATSFTFQTFHDAKHPTKFELAKVITKSPAWPDLLQMYKEGAGIYVTVNETDGTGRKSKNIVRIRAVWQEDDDGFSGSLPLPPSLVVQSSPGRFHRYWLVADDWPADEQGRKDFAAVMERMVQSYGSDKNVKDISRVLRVPGFLHRKGEPHLVTIVEASGRRYTRAQILAVFPPVERAQTKSAHSAPRGLHSDKDLEPLVRIILQAREGERNAKTFWAACRMAEHVCSGQIGRNDMIAIVVEAASRTGLSHAEARQIANSALRTAGAA